MTKSGTFETIQTTEEHPFHVNERGWVKARSLVVGQRLTTATGSEAVVATIAFTGERARVYNLHIEGVHQYLVGDNGILVHNNTPPQLPDGLIAREGQFELRHRYKGYEHAPPHAHLIGPHGEVRVGQNGKPLAGERELTHKEREFLNRSKSKLRSTIDRIMRWYRACRL